MTKTADISRIGQIDFQTGQVQLAIATGTGQISGAVQVPQTLPGTNRFFLLETALLILEDTTTGTNSQGWPLQGASTPDVSAALGVIVPASATPTAPPIGGGVITPPPNQQLGPAVPFVLRLSLAESATIAVQYYDLVTDRKVIIPAGYVFRVYISTPADAAAHAINATLLTQGRWFNPEDCEC